MLRNLSSRATIRLYVLGGILFGFVFPVLAWAVDIWHDNAPWSWEGVWLVHLANPVIWVVDVAPLVSGVFAYAIGKARRADQARRESAEQFHLLFEHNPLPTWVYDAHTLEFLAVNQAAIHHYGYTRAEFSKIKATDIRPPELVPLFLERVRTRPELGTNAPSVHRVKDGHDIEVEVSYHRIIFQGRHALLTVAENVTERKHAEKALQEKEELLRRIVETAEDGIYIVDRNGKMSFANRAMEKIIGVPRNVITSRAFNDSAWKFTTVDGKPFPDEAQPSARVLQSKKPVYNVEQVVARGDGSQVVVSINAAPLLDAKNEVAGVVGSLTDITERKAVERLKNEFVSTVSHELRTPLTSIIGSLGLIMGGATGEVPTPARAMIDIAHKNSERLVRLINDILDIEKIESGKMVFNLKPLALMPLIENALEANRGYGERFGVRLEIAARVDDARVNADHDRLMQVLTNLISNAAKFSPRDGAVRVETTRRDGFLHVAIRDQGAGIPEEFRSRIFQKFAQADSSDTRQKGGTGLGLSIAKAIVEKHGGAIGFETELNVGTTFYFDLPEYLEPAAAPFSNVPSRAAAARDARLLICEDDRDIAKLLSLMLDQSGFKTDVAFNAAQAKQLLAEQSYAAMTLDIALPDQDGIALFRELRAQERTRDLPIIFVSIKAEEGRAELNGDAIKVLDWIDKPIDQARLIAAVRQAIAPLSTALPRVLHIEDDADVRRVVAGILQDTAELASAENLQTAKRILERAEFDLIILDLSLGDGSGAELIPLVHSLRPATPIVIFSAHEVSAELANTVAASLVKSRTSNEDLLQMIRGLVKA